MKPAPFSYTAVNSVAQAIAALAQFGAGAKVIAGGQSLMPAMNMRLARPAQVVDINGIRELDYIRETPGGLAIGALTRHSAIERSQLIKQRNPLLLEAVRQIGHFQIRNRGTIGGSLAHSDPAAEYGVVARLLDAEMVLTGTGGQRVVPAGQFFVSYFTTSMQPGELLTEVRMPVLPPGSGYAFVELSRRHGDFALVAAAATLTLAADGTVQEPRLALGGVGGVPLRTGAAQLLAGRQPEPGLLAQLAQAVSEEVEPESDQFASASYRKHLAGVLARRAFETALQRAKGGAS